MKYLLVTALMIAGSANAGTLNCETYGSGGTFCNGPDGYTSHQETYGGGGTFGGDNRGNTWTTTQYGNGGSFTNFNRNPYAR